MSTLIAKQSAAVPIANTELHELTSACVGQQYLVKVRLPETYAASTETFPVLYLLDGDHAFAMATDIVQYLIYSQQVPDLIIASPAYGSKSTPEYGGTNMRNRDLLPFSLDGSDTPPGGTAFLQFFEQELIPFIESTYRVSSTNRTIAG
jgi:predicted alpha/beta superfamily hydrolase